MISKLKNLKNIKGIYLIAAGFAVGTILILLGSGGKSDEKVQPQTNTVSITDEADKYISALESRVKTLLESMDGISRVQVIITPESSTETVYAENGKYSGGALTEKEYVIKTGDGNPIILNFVYPKLRGIAVVCKGGSNPVNQQKIIGTLCALFDLTASHVYVSG